VDSGSLLGVVETVHKLFRIGSLQSKVMPLKKVCLETASLLVSFFCLTSSGRTRGAESGNVWTARDCPRGFRIPVSRFLNLSSQGWRRGGLRESTYTISSLFDWSGIEYYMRFY
jgi:hypothetical protein